MLDFYFFRKWHKFILWHYQIFVSKSISEFWDFWLQWLLVGSERINKYCLIKKSNDFPDSLKKIDYHGLVIKADGSWPRGRGFKPRHCKLDGCKQFSSHYIKEKLKIMVAKWGTPKNYFKKKRKNRLNFQCRFLSNAN